ncbi:hypothetical protein L1987_09661 [Smallanthus sonchifolius]|uniref:Uncharacterized protein n=1 Tax=Smallanthus sonchifolius TaxID=185202 RepID=A0ACB9JQ08_9ASTR|nr:hypothetical protein L1987_09661 [Smallanthus sonchifolius]
MWTAVGAYLTMKSCASTISRIKCRLISSSSSDGGDVDNSMEIVTFSSLKDDEATVFHLDPYVESILLQKLDRQREARSQSVRATHDDEAIENDEDMIIWIITSNDRQCDEITYLYIIRLIDEAITQGVGVLLEDALESMDVDVVGNLVKIDVIVTAKDNEDDASNEEDCVNNLRTLILYRGPSELNDA